MFLQLAWRNIWRNTRRTTVILIAVIIGVWSMIFLGALMRGIATGMVRNGIATLTGNIQIHRRGYRSDPTVENSIHNPHRIQAILQKILPPRSRWSLRVRVNAIASNARHSAGVTLVGIDPRREAAVSFIGHALFRGRYLDQSDPHAVLIGEALGKQLATNIGRKLVLMSQDTGGRIASRAFRIVGTYRAEMRSTEKRYVFVTRRQAQKMLGLKDGISEVSIVLPGRPDHSGLVRAIRAALPAGRFEVQTWRQLLPMLTAYLNIVDGFIYIWYLVVFIAMGFGIVNTTLMAVFERIREFGLLKALGMKPRWIVREVLTESFLLLIIGMLIGNLLAIICISALSGGGIDLSAFAAGAEFAGMSRIIYPDLAYPDLVAANLLVLALGLVVSAYPALKAARLTPVEALAQT